MKRRTLARIAAVALVVIVLGTGYAWLGDDRTPPKLPTESTKNTLALTSNGCCFWVEDVAVSLLGAGGDTLPIAQHDKIYEDDIYRHAIPNFADTPFQLVVSFRAFYGEMVDFAMPVLAFESIGDLQRTGVLLYFQEHDDVYLHVIAGNHHISYKMGSESNRWASMDAPNRVYGRD